MGADGGTIPKRCELVRKKKKKEKIDKSYRDATKWKTCQLSQEPLKKPVVACKLGRLYNKEAVLEAKLNKTLASNSVTKHIRTLGDDVKELRLTDNRGWKDTGPEKGDVYIDMNETPWVCPITALPMNGTNTFLINWTCGCVFSEKAVQELPAVKNCHGCGGSMDAEKLIKLYPDEELLRVYEQRIANEQSQRKLSKKQGKIDENNGKSEVKHEKRKLNTAKDGNGLAKKLKGEKDYSSIQENPNVPTSVKAMFTTSDEAKRQPTAHWVTHNPLYY